MSYIATTIKNAVINMINRTTFLPAIQREFVWSPWDVAKLFDSIMCQYPISSMLFWKIREENKKDWVAYRFFSDFDITKPHNEEANLNGVNNDVFLVLDGQQRLTAMNIGLHGSYAYKYYTFRKRKLYLNIVAPPKESPNPEELSYVFRFRENASPDPNQERSQLWYEVGNVLDFDDAEYAKTALKESLSRFSPEQQEIAGINIGRLFFRICANDCINYYEERTEDYNKIVEIFIRTNTGGKKLSYSDILLSTATAKWRHLNAREEIHNYTDDLEKESNLILGQDLIMKGAMYLTKDLPIKYQFSSFTKSNLEKIEDNWDRIKESFREAVLLVSSFGFRDRNLVSKNLILPIALYIYYNYSKDYYRSSHAEHVQNQNKIQKWFILSTLRNLLQSSTDDKLKTIQSIIIDHVRKGNKDFPSESIDTRFNINTPLTEEQIEQWLRYGYATKYSYLLLSLLYPNRDWKDNRYNEDHIYPKKIFTPKNLREYRLSEEQIVFALDNYNTILNLELLEERENKSKNDKPFDEWINSRDANFKQRHSIPEMNHYMLSDFTDFINQRKHMLIARLKPIINSNTN